MFDNLPGAFVIDQGKDAQSVTAGGTAHTKGSWLEITSSTSAIIGFLNITTALTHTSGSDSSTLMDIGTGSAGSETVIVPDIPVGHSLFAGFERMQHGFSIPVWIPASTRVAVRTQSVTASKSVTFSMHACGFASTAPTDWPGKTNTWEHIGINSSNSSGTTMSGTSWQTVIASTANTYQQIIPILHGGDNSSMGTDQTMEIGSGAASSEVVKRKIYHRTGVAEKVDYQTPSQPVHALLMQWTETSGTRLAAKPGVASAEPYVSFLVCQ